MKLYEAIIKARLDYYGNTEMYEVLTNFHIVLENNPELEELIEAKIAEEEKST